MAFVLTSDLEGLSYSRGSMGLPQDSFFAVEIDTLFDPVVDDINGSHVGIDVDDINGSHVGIDVDDINGSHVGIDLNTVESVAFVNAGVDLVGGHSSENKPSSPVIVAQIDLSMQFKELVYVGLTASNGKGDSSAYIVNSWRFKT
ncbi:hypothetical protein ACLB2K_034844 [Fragaria x ananassa]